MRWAWPYTNYRQPCPHAQYSEIGEVESIDISSEIIVADISDNPRWTNMCSRVRRCMCVQIHKQTSPNPRFSTILMKREIPNLAQTERTSVVLAIAPIKHKSHTIHIEAWGYYYAGIHAQLCEVREFSEGRDSSSEFVRLHVPDCCHGICQIHCVGQSLRSNKSSCFQVSFI